MLQQCRHARPGRQNRSVLHGARARRSGQRPRSLHHRLPLRDLHPLQQPYQMQCRLCLGWEAAALQVHARMMTRVKATGKLIRMVVGNRKATTCPLTSAPRYAQHHTCPCTMMPQHSKSFCAGIQTQTCGTRVRPLMEAVRHSHGCAHHRRHKIRRSTPRLHSTHQHRLLTRHSQNRALIRIQPILHHSRASSYVPAATQTSPLCRPLHRLSPQGSPDS